MGQDGHDYAYPVEDFGRLDNDGTRAGIKNRYLSLYEIFVIYLFFPWQLETCMEVNKKRG